MLNSTQNTSEKKNMKKFTNLESKKPIQTNTIPNHGTIPLNIFKLYYAIDESILKTTNHFQKSINECGLSHIEYSQFIFIR